jgi:diguanylate cyclase (GGDEF)-like protein/PAS domain S-box-containing protein
MAKADNLVRIVLVEDSTEDAEHAISVLRNAGISVRPTRAVDADQLKTALDAPQDLVLYSARAKKLTLKETAEAVDKTGKDIPVLAVMDALTQESLLAALRDGARSVLIRGMSDFFQTMAQREFSDLQTRRAVRKLEISLRESEKRCNALLDSSRDPIAYVHEGMHVYANKAYLEMFKIEEYAEIEGTTFLDMLAGKDVTVFRDVLKQISKGEKPPEKLNLKAQRTDGSTFDAVMELSEASVENEPCTQIVIRQQTGNAELAKELDALRRQDLVTGLLNKQAFTEELQKAVAAASGGQTDQAVIYLEIDNYKKHLEVVGIDGVDTLLADMGGFLRTAAGANAHVARLADHSFGIILLGMVHQRCIEFATKLVKHLEDHVIDAGRTSITLTGSFGMCLMSEKMTAPQDVLNKAAEASQAAMRDGGNRLITFDPMEKEKADEAESAKWINSIKNALTKDGFNMMYQPIVSLQGESGEFYEVLLRMNGPNGEVQPGVFFPVAEKLGLLAHIDRWVIAKIIRTVAERQASGINSTFFIKICPQTIEDGSILPWLAQQLKVARVAGDRLVFEMPESKVVTYLKQVAFFQAGLAQLRCGFALEQFGPGINSFRLLKHVNADYLKIDRSFMAELAKSKENQEKVRSIAAEARNAGKITVAEFVEDAGSMSILFSCGVNFVQGNFLQEPQRVMAYDFG